VSHVDRCAPGIPERRQILLRHRLHLSLPFEGQQWRGPLHDLGTQLGGRSVAPLLLVRLAFKQFRQGFKTAAIFAADSAVSSTAWDWMRSSLASNRIFKERCRLWCFTNAFPFANHDDLRRARVSRSFQLD
jgi:hypothetical protein